MPTTVRTDRAQAVSLDLPKEDGVFHFAIFGDRTGGPDSGLEILARAVEETNLLDPDLVMTVGDLVQGYNQTPLWLKQMHAYKATMSGLDMPWYPVAGNHDIYWHGGEPPAGQHEANYESHFGPLWYWFPHKNAAFVVLYTDEGNRETNKKGYGSADLVQMSDEQIEWLAGTLRRTASYDHVFVFMHHPRWMADVYPKGGNWDRVHDLLRTAGNVAAVFAGHIHYQRYDGLRDGITYYSLATIGGIMPMDVPGSGSLNHIDLVTVRKDRFEIATLPVGTVIDPETMTPEHTADVRRASRLPIALLTDRLDLARDGAAAGEVRFRIENTANRPVEVAATLAAKAGDWFVRPNDRHLRLDPSEVGEVAFDLRRPGDGLEAAFSVPAFAFQVDYLAADRRVGLAPQYRVVPLRPTTAATFSPATDGALVLDGVDASLWFDARAVPLDAPRFTLEAYVRPDTLAGHQAVIGTLHDSGYALMHSDGRPRFYVILKGGPVDLLAPADQPLVAGRWTHLAGVFDGNEARLYVDGALIAKTPVTAAPPSNALPLHVGANPDDKGGDGDHFKGAIDEVRISTVARYRGESFTPAPRHRADAATALLLHFDGGDVPFARDASPHRRDGIALGTPRFTTR
jgi:hypothetical protein